MANPRNTSSLAELRESLKDASSFYLVNYQGLTAAGLGSLRKELRQSGSQLLVAKNTLINIALQEKGANLRDVLHGPSAVVLIGADPVGPAKTLVDFAKKNDKGIPAPKGGMLDGALVDAKQVESIASLPGKDELRSELVGVLQAPLSNLVSVLGAKQQEFVGILDAKVQQA